MEELQTYITELGMKEAIYDDTHESPDLVKFSTEMKELILQQEPPYQNGMLVFILNPLVALEAVVQQAAQLVINSWEAERLRARHNTRTLEGAEVLPITKTRRLTPQIS